MFLSVSGKTIYFKINLLELEFLVSLGPEVKKNVTHLLTQPRMTF